MSAATDPAPVSLSGRFILLVEDRSDDEALTLRARSRNGIRREHAHSMISRA